MTQPSSLYVLLSHCHQQLASPSMWKEARATWCYSAVAWKSKNFPTRLSHSVGSLLEKEGNSSLVSLETNNNLPSSRTSRNGPDRHGWLLLDPSRLEAMASDSLLRFYSVRRILSVSSISIRLKLSCKPPRPDSKFLMRSLSVAILIELWYQCLVPIKAVK